MFGEKKKRVPGEFDAAFAGMTQPYSPLSQATASQGAIGNMAPVSNAVAAAPTSLAPKKKGLFGKGGVGRAIAGTIGDFLMQRSGMAPVYAPAMMMQRQEAAQAAAERLKRAQDLSDWRMKEDYKRENPSQTAFQQDYEYIRRNFGEDAANTYRENKINPPVWRQGADGQFYRVETAQPQVLGDSLPEGWEIEGGPSQPATGGF